MREISEGGDEERRKEGGENADKWDGKREAKEEMINLQRISG